MPTDYYDDSTDSGETTKAQPKAKTDEGAATALLPLDFFPDEPEPGKVCKIRVEKVYGDQASVSYVKHETEAEDEVAPETESDMDEMMA